MNKKENYRITVTYNQHLQTWTATDNISNTVGFGNTDMEAFQHYLTQTLQEKPPTNR